MHFAVKTTQTISQAEFIDRVKSLVPLFAKRSRDAEIARTLPKESVEELLEAGIARTMMPKRYGGYAFGFDVWYELIREISKADASHGWCAGLIAHGSHLISQFPVEAQKAVWADGPDVAIAGSIMPALNVTRVDGGYRVSGQNSSFASGINHSRWAVLGGFVPAESNPQWAFFLVPASDYEIRDTWFAGAMCGTGSNTVITDDVFVPESHVMLVSDLFAGTGPGASVDESYIFKTPFRFYSPINFVAPMLGAAQGSYEYFRNWMTERRDAHGNLVAESPTFQLQMARAAADLDAAELLLERCAILPAQLEGYSPSLLARSARDYSRAAELITAAIDGLLSLSGTAGFTQDNKIQRAWKDIHFAARHISLNVNNNYSQFARSEFGLETAVSHPFAKPK